MSVQGTLIRSTTGKSEAVAFFVSSHLFRVAREGARERERESRIVDSFDMNSGQPRLVTFLLTFQVLPRTAVSWKYASQSSNATTPAAVPF